MTVPRTAILLAALLAARGAASQAPGGAAPPPGPERLPETPREYQGAAHPLDSRDTAAAVARARAQLEAGEWGRGFAMLDELLASISSPRGKKKATSTAPAAPPPNVNAIGAVEPAMAAPPLELEIEPGEEVLTLDGIRFLPAAAAIRSLLLGIPPEGKAVYETTYGAPAREALEKARALDPTKAPAELRRIAERWPLTRAAASARELLAARLLATGRPGEAARSLETRLELAADPSERAALLARLAMALELAGSPASSDRALARLAREHPDQTVAVRGEEVAVPDLARHDLFRALRERRAPAGAEAAAWVSEGGSFAHSAAPIPLERAPPLGSRAAWIHPPPQPGASRSDAERSVIPMQPDSIRSGVSLGRMLFLREGADVIALDAWTGKRLWEASPAEQAAPAGFIQQGRRIVRIGRVRHSVDGAAPASQALAVLPAAGSRQALVIGIDRPPGIDQDVSGSIRYHRNALVACSARTGKLVWRAELPARPGGLGGAEEEDDDGGGLAFLGPPVAAGDVLVAPASNGEAVHAVGLTPGGKVLWRRRLFTWSLQAQGFFLIPGASFAAADGIAAFAGGHGLACAVDTATGEILWASRYRSGLRAEGAGRHYQGGRSAPALIIPANAPGGEPLLVAAPADTDTVTAFDLRTGSIRWEKSFDRRTLLLVGAAGGKVLAATDRVHALGAEKGETLWESEPLGGILSGIVGEGFVIVNGSGGTLTRIDPSTGKVESKLRILDPRLPAFEPLQLLVAGDSAEPARLIGIGPGVAFAVEPQDASWIAIAGEARPPSGVPPGDRRLFERARLLRAEARHADALQILERLYAGLRSEELKDSVKADIVAVSRSAAETLEDPAFLARLLERDLVDAPKARAELQLLQARIFEKRSSKDEDPRLLEGAARIYLELARKESLLASAPGGLLVDAGAHASEALREIRAKLPPESRGIAMDPRAEESARAALERPGDRRVLSRLALRRPHLDAAEEAARRLVARARDDAEAAEVSRFLIASFPALADDSGARAASERILPPPFTEIPVPGLASVLDARGGRPLASRFTVSSEDAFIASTSPGSLPLPALAAIAGTRLRLYDADGRIILERPLPGYPDVSAAKVHLQSNAEEPAEADLREEGLVLFTQAGLYAFRGLERGAPRAREFRLTWASGWQHPLVSKMSTTRMHWHGGMPSEGLFTSPAWTAAGMPLVLSDDWTLSGLDQRTGKYVFRIPRGEPTGNLGAPASAIARGNRVEAMARAPAGVAIYTLPGAGKRAPPARAVGLEEGQAGAARLAAGGLVALFEGQALTAVEAESGARLWSRESGFATVAFTTADAVWLCEEEGKLTARSLRTGRERGSLDLPVRGRVVDAFEDRDGEGRVVARWLLVSRNAVTSVQVHSGQSPDRTGMDLHLVRIDPEGKKLSDAVLHEGTVAYTRTRLLVGPGRALILWNGESKDGKWYTRAVEAGPAGISEVLSFEIQGKGTGQSPRVAVLEGGLAVGNAGGFSWFTPAGDSPGAKKDP